MFRNYFKTALRNLLRHKSYGFINIAGLSIGIAACLLIFLVVRYELSYNTAQPNYDHIFHIVTEDRTPDGSDFNPGVPYPVLEALRSDFPNTTVGALYATYGTQFTIPNNQGRASKKFMEDYGVFFADPGFFKVMSFKWLAGNAAVLAQPNTIVLTQSVATKYFGSWQNAVGQQLLVENAMTMKVAGILENPPANSDFPLNIVGSFVTIKNNRYFGYTTDWGSTTSNFQVFMLAPPSLLREAIDKQLAGLADKYYKNEGVNRRWNLAQPLSELHFDPRLPNFGDHITSRSTLVTLGMIGFFIIIMACINFINLSTAQAVKRSKEVGVRKVLGSRRIQLFAQVISETGVIVCFSALIALLLAKIALPYMKHIASINEELGLLNFETLVFVLLTVLIVTGLSGIYPALVMSGFQPVVALKNKISSASVGGISLRRGLVVTQFAISQVLIVSTIVAVSQMNFVRTADLGFNKAALLVIASSTDSVVQLRQQPFKERLLQVPGVKLVSLSSDVPSSENNQGTNFAYDHRDDETFTLYTKFADADYFKTFDLQFVAGEAYKPGDTSGKVVVNETLLKKLNINNPQQAIGKQVRTGRGRWRSIAGVVKDFKTNSLREETKPLMIAPRRKQFDVISVKLSGAGLAATVGQIEKIWDKFYPEYVFSSNFMDERIAEFYRQENQMALLYKIFAALAVFISCLGLYGLVSFMAAQRTKEVGIRKVLGAGVTNIVLLFSKEFTWLIVIAFAISAPLAWYFMNSWLSNFAYRVTIGWAVFAMAVAASVLVAWLSVGYKAFMAAVANPVKSLRTE